MVSVEYSNRIVCDESFITKLFEENNSQLFIGLRYIKYSSKYFKTKHNIILKDKYILSKKKKANIGCFFAKLENYEEIQNSEDLCDEDKIIFF